MKVESRRWAGTALMLMLASSCWLGAASAQDEDVGRESDASLQGYAEELQITIAEARLRRARIREAELLQQQLQQAFPETFAGMYLEYTPLFRSVVLFTQNPQQQLARYTQDPWYVARAAPRSLRFLEGVQIALSEELQKLGIQFLSELDIKKSQIDLYVLDPDEVKKKLSSLLESADFIKVHKTTGFIETTAMTGGKKLVDSNGNARCTSGFNVVHRESRELGLLTAGHCTGVHGYITPGRKLELKARRNVGSYDMQWFIQSGKKYEPQENLIYINRKHQNEIEIKRTISLKDMMLDDIVCKNGITTRYTCGKIINKSSMSMHEGKLGVYVRVRRDNNRVMTSHGDSGGPVFMGRTAYGIVHGRGDLGSEGRNDLFFMPIERISALGISVLTEKLRIEKIPSASGKHGAPIPVRVHFKGYPRFPVELAVDVVQCPSGWRCEGGKVQYTENKPSPLQYRWGCNAHPSQPTASFRIRTRMKDASGLNPPAVLHTITCRSHSGGRSGLPSPSQPTSRLQPAV